MSKFVSLCDPRGRSQAHAWQNCYLAEVKEEDDSNATCFVKSRLILEPSLRGAYFVTLPFLSLLDQCFCACDSRLRQTI